MNTQEETTHNQIHIAAMGRQDDCRPPSLVSKVGTFGWHLVQMILAMQLGMQIFHWLLSARLMTYPVLHETVMEVFMVAPMVVLMAVQRHRWRHTLEMAGAMLLGPAVLIACVQFGLCRHLPVLSAQTLFSWVDLTMYLGMLAAMLYRREHYLGHMGDTTPKNHLSWRQLITKSRP